MRNLERLKLLIRALLSKSPGGLPSVKLAKLILFTDLEYYRKYGKSFTGLYYVRKDYGPVVAYFNTALSEEVSSGVVKEKHELTEYGTVMRTYELSAHDIQIPEDLSAILEEVFRKYGDKSGSKLSDLSHKLPAWKYAEPDEPLYIEELAIEDEDEYFRFIELLEDMEDPEEDNVVASLLDRISEGEGRVR